jgi:alpha-tubulin suppressor-like RCC1 family protein
VGNNTDGQCNVGSWKDIVAIDAGFSHVVGLTSYGTVVATGWNAHGQLNVSEWESIVAIAAGHNHTVGLVSDGTVIAVGGSGYGECDVESWRDIVAIAAGVNYTLGLKSDGTIVMAGSDFKNMDAVLQWKGIAMPTIQSNSKDDTLPSTYKPLRQGDRGGDVLTMKERMQELGYFSASATLSNQYNATTTERVKLFQKANGLKQTGIADETMLNLLFSNDAKRNPY